MTRTMCRTDAFTLIELLLTIGVIILFSAILLVTMNAARMKARDAQRKQDLRTIDLALEQFFDSNGYYPAPKSNVLCGGSDTWANSIGSCGGQWLTDDPKFIALFPRLPIDPLNVARQGTSRGGQNGNHTYTYTGYLSADGRWKYELVTQLENSNDPETCTKRRWVYHNSLAPWCPPWPGNLGRSGNIYSSH